MLQYEEARNKELGRFENPVPTSGMCIAMVMFRSGYVSHPEMLKGTAREPYICYQAEIGSLCVCSLICRKCIPLSVGLRARKWWAMESVCRMIARYPRIMERHVQSSDMMGSFSFAEASSSTRILTVSITAMSTGPVCFASLCLENLLTMMSRWRRVISCVLVRVSCWWKSASDPVFDYLFFFFLCVCMLHYSPLTHGIVFPSLMSNSPCRRIH